MHAPLHPAHAKQSQSLSSACPTAYRHVPPSVYSQVSTFRSLKLEVQIYSPSVRVHQGKWVGGSLVPVFSDDDKIEGKVTLDRSCHHSGTLSVTVEGALRYRLSKESRAPAAGFTRATQFDGKHVFLSSTTTIAVSPFQASGGPALALRDAFIKRRPSYSSISSRAAALERPFPFSLSFAGNPRPGEGLPPTLAPLPALGSDSEDFDISYVVVATWQPGDATLDNPSRLEIPIHFHPTNVPRPREISPTQQESWLELPLRSDHPVSFRCAVTLPTSVTFTRGSSIPYFVVFATKPRSSALAREIAADATISVSLIRKLTMTEQINLPPSPPQTPPSPDEGDLAKNRLLRRVRNGQLLSKTITSPSSWNSPRHSPVEEEKPLPRLPTQVVFSDTKTLKNDVCVGFPKRPRRAHKHSYVEESATLPDGLYRSKMSLKSTLLPSVNVQGLIVKYYLDVSVLFGQDDLRARIPIRVV